jgi:tryptophanyl-tRNA synthetase
MKKSMRVTPWEVSGDVDYDKIMKDFGISPLDDKLLKRLKKHTKQLHPYLKRKIVFSHRDFDKILDYYEKGIKFALYTGRGPSGKTHLGHLIPWIFTKWLQDKFGCELYFEITDAEKYLVKNLTLEDTRRLSYDNVLDLIALGFDPKKTFVFLDTELGKTQFRVANLVAKKINFSTVKAVFGFTNETNIGLIFHPAVQATPCFLPSIKHKKKIPVLIPASVDQDPYWRGIAREVAPKLGYYRPAQMYNILLPSLTGREGKMSSSIPSSAIFTTDSPREVERKIMRYAFSGGQKTMEEHKQKGGNPDIDISYSYLTFFEKDDAKLEKIYNDYKSGNLSTKELKRICIKTINNFLRQHQEKRKRAIKIREKFMWRD